MLQTTLFSNFIVTPWPSPNFKEVAVCNRCLVQLARNLSVSMLLASRVLRVSDGQSWQYLKAAARGIGQKPDRWLEM